MSSSGGDRDLAVEPGHHLDVVDRQHVGRVGHRQNQRLLVDVADRDRLVAPRGGHREQVRGAHVDLVEAEVEVVEAVALGDRPRELIAVDHLVLAQERFGGPAGAARLVDHLVDALASRVAELDDHVGDEHPRVAAVHRRREPVGGGLGAAIVELAGGRLARVGHWSQVVWALQDSHPAPAARRIVSIGGSCPVQMRSDAAPWRTSTSSPSTTVAPCALADSGELRLGGPVGEVHQLVFLAQRIGTDGQALEVRSPFTRRAHAHDRRVDDQVEAGGCQALVARRKRHSRPTHPRGARPSRGCGSRSKPRRPR